MDAHTLRANHALALTVLAQPSPGRAHLYALHPGPDRAVRAHRLQLPAKYGQHPYDAVRALSRFFAEQTMARGLFIASAQPLPAQITGAALAMPTTRRTGGRTTHAHLLLTSTPEGVGFLHERDAHNNVTSWNTVTPDRRYTSAEGTPMGGQEDAPQPVSDYHTALTELAGHLSRV